MSKNWKFGNIGNDVTLALAVPAGTKGGDVIVLPDLDGTLIGYAVTDRGTSDGPNAAGIINGYASVRLAPAEGVVELEVDGGGLTLGAPVYATYADGAWSYTTASSQGATRKVHIGHIVTPDGHTPASGHAFVFLGTAGALAPVGAA